MDYKEVKKLADKFFNGKTTLEEEQVLKDYFKNSKDIPSDLLYAKELFCHFISESKETTDIPVVKKVKRILPRSVLVFTGIAASIILVFGIIFFTEKENKPVYAYLNGVPVTDEYQALNETYKAINLISKNLNRGTEDLNYLNKFNRIETLIKNK